MSTVSIAVAEHELDKTDSRRLTRVEIENLLETAEEDDNRREYRRFRISSKAILTLKVTHPHRLRGTFLVRPRNMSSGGIGFRHADALPVGTVCEIVVISQDRQGVVVSGNVVRCRQINSKAYDVGIRFDESVEIHSFLD